MFAPMPRPVQPRTIEFVPRVTFFKPAGIPRVELEEVALTLDELEALWQSVKRQEKAGA